MTEFTRAESLHRLVKQALDSGAACSLAEAEALFRGYNLEFVIGSSESEDPLHQIALLTGVALARRVFLGGVTVQGSLDAPVRAPLLRGMTLSEAVKALGGSVQASAPGTPTIIVGGGPRPRSDGFSLRTCAAGWRGGIVPAHSKLSPSGPAAMPLTAMLAAAFAVNEAFLYVSGGTPSAGHRAIGLSLWDPQAETNWLTSAVDEPALSYLPNRLWLIGLGHLGQAYLWGLGLLPYENRAELSLVLQDVDVITPSTESTSILTDSSMVGLKKTRVMAAWAEARGFSTTIYERLFDDSFHRQDDEPAIALCGLDNAIGRHALDRVGFSLVVEAGLGRGHRDFRTMRLHTLPCNRAAVDIWKIPTDTEIVEDRAAYQKMLRDGELDRCGVTLLAGRAVGAPFVGAIAACLALAEVLRLLHRGPVFQLIDLDLQSVEHRATVLNTSGFRGLNPGYVPILTRRTEREWPNLAAH